MASTPDGKGYWLVASDGGIFSFGDAAFHGSMGGHAAQRSPSWAWPPTRRRVATGRSPPTAASSATTPRSSAARAASGSTSPSSAWRHRPTAQGYRFVASDGGIFTYGNATVRRLDRRHHAWTPPVVGMAPDNATNGYWMAAADGGIFTLRRRLRSWAGWSAEASHGNRSPRTERRVEDRTQPQLSASTLSLQHSRRDGRSAIAGTWLPRCGRGPPATSAGSADEDEASGRSCRLTPHDQRCRRMQWAMRTGGRRRGRRRARHNI